MNAGMENISIPATANYVKEGDGPPVILIHGLAASLHDWDDLIPELAANGYSAYAPDLLGHGTECYRIASVSAAFVHRSLR